MKSIKRDLRLLLLGAVTAGVCFPALNRLGNVAARADSLAPPALDGARRAPAANLPDVDDDKVIFSMGSIKCTAGEFKAYISECEPSVRELVMVDPNARRRLAETFINTKLMALEAKKLKLDDSRRVHFIYDELLSNALALKYGEQEIDNKKFFEQNVDYFSQVTVRHILIAVAGGGVPGALRSEADAKTRAEAIKKQLDKGDSFTDLARSNSDDRSSAPTGGELPPISRGRMSPEFEKVAFKLKDNEISDPVKTPFGYEIIQVLGHSILTYKDAAPRIPQRRLEVMLEELKQADKPEFDDSYFSKGQAAK